MFSKNKMFHSAPVTLSRHLLKCFECLNYMLFTVYTLCENHHMIFNICENIKSFRLFASQLSTLSTKQCIIVSIFFSLQKQRLKKREENVWKELRILFSLLNLTSGVCFYINRNCYRYRYRFASSFSFFFFFEANRWFVYFMFFKF